MGPVLHVIDEGGLCIDINECLGDNMCAWSMKSCTNTHGGYSCEPGCDEGSGYNHMEQMCIGKRGGIAALALCI